MAALEAKVDGVVRDVTDIKGGLIRIEGKLDKKADCEVVDRKADAKDLKTVKEETEYWRNILVAGVLVSIFLMLISISLTLVFRK